MLRIRRSSTTAIRYEPHLPRRRSGKASIRNPGSFEWADHALFARPRTRRRR